MAVAIEVHLAHAMAPENLQPPFPRLFDEPARAVDPGLAPRLELGVIGHGGIRGEAQRADVPPKGVDLAARLVGVGESVWEPRLEIDAQRVVGVVLDHDPAPASIPSAVAEACWRNWRRFNRQTGIAPFLFDLGIAGDLPTWGTRIADGEYVDTVVKGEACAG